MQFVNKAICSASCIFFEHRIYLKLYQIILFNYKNHINHDIYKIIIQTDYLLVNYSSPVKIFCR